MRNKNTQNLKAARYRDGDSEIWLVSPFDGCFRPRGHLSRGSLVPRCCETAKYNMLTGGDLSTSTANMLFYQDLASPQLSSECWNTGGWTGSLLGPPRCCRSTVNLELYPSLFQSSNTQSLPQNRPIRSSVCYDWLHPQEEAADPIFQALSLIILALFSIPSTEEGLCHQRDECWETWPQTFQIQLNLGPSGSNWFFFYAS